MAKTIIFDLDGTLTDSGAGIINCAKFTLEYFNLPIPSPEELRTIVGPPLVDSFIKFGVDPKDADRAVEVYRSRYIPIGMYENAPYPGIPELLQQLKNQGHRLCIATCKPEQMAAEILTHFGLAQYFDHICGASTDRTRNTKEAVIAHLLQQAAPQGQLVMVGDTHIDVLGAAYHKIPAIGVAWGYGSVEAMVEAGAAAIARDTQDLLELLNQ